MNLVGKIFIFLVFLMSVVFAAFTVMVFTTHKNWRDDVLRTEPAPGSGLVGWQKRLENQQKLNDALRSQKGDLEDRLAAMEAAKRQEIAKLEQEKERLKAEADLLKGNYNEKSVLLAKALTDVELAENKLEILRTEGNSMRGEIRSARLVIDKKFDELLKLAEQLHQSKGQLVMLEERRKELTGALTQAEQVLDSHGLKKEMPLDNLEPLVDGIVTQVKKHQNDIYVEVTVGTDDGLKKGHLLEVFRGANYLGQIQIVQATPDKAVGKVDLERMQGTIQARDRVRSRRGLKLTGG